jgi:hypothetical protein
MYEQMGGNVEKGNFFQLFSSRNIFKKYLYCILMGLPIWYIIGILVFSAPEISALVGIDGKLSGGNAIMYCYIGLALGDFASGALSQWLKSRGKAVFIYLMIAVGICIYYLFGMSNITTTHAYAMIALLGFFGGYWAVFLTYSSEQFGTNIRMTVTTTVPNFVRGALIPISLLFKFLIPSVGLINAAAYVGVLCFSLAIFAVSQLKETYGKSLEYVE